METPRTEFLGVSWKHPRMEFPYFSGKPAPVTLVVIFFLISDRNFLLLQLTPSLVLSLCSSKKSLVPSYL